jgi:hypothetical protein
MWQEMGFPDKETAAYWEERTCGVACIKMILEAATQKSADNMYNLTQDLYQREAFLPKVGWIHQKLADYGIEKGLKGFRKNIKTSSEIIELLQDGYLIIVSIGVGFEDNKKSGHLILVHGAVTENNQCTHLIVHHPSCRENYEYVDRKIPINLFTEHFSGNIIALKKD